MPLSPSCRLNCSSKEERDRERERKREEEQEKELQRENKALWSGTSLLCQTIMCAMGIEDRGEEERAALVRKKDSEKTKTEEEDRKKKTDNKCEEGTDRREWEDGRNTSALTVEGSTLLAQTVCLSVCASVVGKWNCCGCAWLL